MLTSFILILLLGFFIGQIARRIKVPTVDPTKVAIASRIIILAAVDTSAMATQVLTKAADFARRSNGEVIVIPSSIGIQFDSCNFS
ncbi:MAG: hypothetical protein ACFCUV_10835 [Rivularia sp. (in: cyanobacteria)]